MKKDRGVFTDYVSSLEDRGESLSNLSVVKHAIATFSDDSNRFRGVSPITGQFSFKDENFNHSFYLDKFTAQQAQEFVVKDLHTAAAKKEALAELQEVNMKALQHCTKIYGTGFVQSRMAFLIEGAVGSANYNPERGLSANLLQSTSEEIQRTKSSPIKRMAVHLREAVIQAVNPSR